MNRGDERTGRQVVHVIRKGPKQEIRISVSAFRGKEFVDLRTYVSNRLGVFVPTRLGITVPTHALCELELAVQRLRDAVEVPPPPL